MKWLSQKTIDALQWILIVALLAMLIIQGVNFKQVKKDLVTSEQYNKNNTYVRIYESQKLSSLKKQNQELYDSISNLQNVETGMIIKFKEKYVTDTITVDKFIVKADSIAKDSVYHYTQSNDTVKLNIDIKAKDLKWCKTDLTIHDKFMIINREKDGVNQTSINHSANTEIEETTMWHKKNNKKWYQKFVISPQVGVGYGVFNKKPDVFVGVGIGYDF